MSSYSSEENRTGLGSSPVQAAQSPQIPDHELVRSIGSGSYGQVWLARNVMGTYRAIKIIYRKTFRETKPFDREFYGIKKFEPISRSDPGLVSILHIGRNYDAEYFYYIMEIADDVVSGQQINPANYSPKTLSSELGKRGHLPIEECQRIALCLCQALAHLHRHSLVHRDIKPSNIIFVNGIAKFADIGLVTDIGDAATFVGTEGYVPPEGPGRPTADLYSLGKVFYEMSLGRDLEEFPEWPQHLEKASAGPKLLKFYEIVRKACDVNPRRRWQSAQEMTDRLSRLQGTLGRASRSYVPEPGEPTPADVRVAILCCSDFQPDDRLLRFLREGLTRQGFGLLQDQYRSISVEWAREIEDKIAQANVLIALLSPNSIQSEMMAYQLEMAHETAQHHQGKPRLLPVRLQLEGQLPPQLRGLLDSLPFFIWDGPDDDQRLITELALAIRSAHTDLAPAQAPELESPGGPVPLDSKFYVVRPVDEEFASALARGDSIVLLKGARQMGKTSLLARGLQQAREEGLTVVLADFQQLNAASLESLSQLYLTLAGLLADQLDLNARPESVWNERTSPNSNFERYLRRELLDKVDSNLIWGLDEVDRLFTRPYSNEVFSLFRSWHNKRALDPVGPWSKLTLAIAYATEAHLFITDLVQSPFNVGTRLWLEDFRVEQVAELNRRYGSPLKTPDEISRFALLTGGQPFLVRRGLDEFVAQKLSFETFQVQADRDEGIYGDHLRRILLLLVKDPGLLEIVRGILQGQPCPSPESFYRLRSAGLISGDSASAPTFRCHLYADYLRRHLVKS